MFTNQTYDIIRQRILDNLELDINVLKLMYKNAKMGIIGIENIKGGIKDKEFGKLIREQENDYYEICTRIIKELSVSNNDREDVSKMAELMTFMEATMELIKDNSPSNIAKMMIKATNTGIIEIEEKLNNIEGIDKRTVKLGKELLAMEKRNINNLKKLMKSDLYDITILTHVYNDEESMCKQKFIDELLANSKKIKKTN